MKHSEYEYYNYIQISREDRIKIRREYLSQYVDQSVIDLVLEHISKEEILNSRAENFENISIFKWFDLVSKLSGVEDKLKANGGKLTPGSGIQILKEAAQQIKDISLSTQ